MINLFFIEQSYSQRYYVFYLILNLDFIKGFHILIVLLS
jgi:hypothetical protein